MYLQTNATKTFNQWLTDNPHFYDHYLSLNLIDESTISLIQKFYGLRILCDDDNFETFYERQLDLCLNRYNKLLRLENTEFDALVNTYRTRTKSGTASETGTIQIDRSTSETTGTTREIDTVVTPNITVTDSGTNSATIGQTEQHANLRTPNLEVAESSSSTSSSDTDTTSSTTTSGTNSSTSSTATVSKQNPQSISYAQAPAGAVPSLDWQYPSAQSQTDSTTSGTNSGTSSATGSSDTDNTASSSTTTATTGTESNTGSDSLDRTESGTKANTNITTGTEHTETTDGITGTKTGSGSDTHETEKAREDSSSETWSGLDDLTPQEALALAMNYVKTSSAFVWLKDQLSVCFLSIYDI